MNKTTVEIQHEASHTSLLSDGASSRGGLTNVMSSAHLSTQGDGAFNARDINAPMAVNGASVDLEKPFLRYVRVRCTDIEATELFYTKVLLMEVVEKIETPGAVYLYMRNVDDSLGIDGDANGGADLSIPTTPHLNIRFEYDKRKEQEQADANEKRDQTRDDVFFVYYVKHIMPFMGRMKDNNFPIWIPPQEFYRSARIAQINDPNGLKIRLVQLPEEAMKTEREIQLNWTCRLAYVSVRCSDVTDTIAFYEELFSAAANVFIPASFIARKRGTLRRVDSDVPDYALAESPIGGLTASPSHTKLMSENVSRMQSRIPSRASTMNRVLSTTSLASHASHNSALEYDEDGIPIERDPSHSATDKKGDEGRHAFLSLRTGFRVIDQENFSHNRSSYVWFGHGDRSTFPCICFVEFFDTKGVPPPTDFLGLGFSVRDPKDYGEQLEEARPNMELFFPDTGLELRGHGYMFRFPDNNDIAVEISRYGDPSYFEEAEKMGDLVARLEDLENDDEHHDVEWLVSQHRRDQDHEGAPSAYTRPLGRHSPRSPSWSGMPGVRRTHSDVGFSKEKTPMIRGEVSMKSLRGNPDRSSSPLSQSSMASHDGALLTGNNSYVDITPSISDAHLSESTAARQSGSSRGDLHRTSRTSFGTIGTIPEEGDPDQVSMTSGIDTVQSSDRLGPSSSQDGSAERSGGLSKQDSQASMKTTNSGISQNSSLPDLDNPASLYGAPKSESSFGSPQKGEGLLMPGSLYNQEHRSAQQLRQGMFTIDSDDSSDDGSELLASFEAQSAKQLSSYNPGAVGGGHGVPARAEVDLSKGPTKFSAQDVGISPSVNRRK